MPTIRETILAALHARLSALPATALRGEVLPERVPAEGLLILRDGEPGEPEVTLSPLRYHYQHRAEIEAVVQGTDRDAAFDTLTASVGAALAGTAHLTASVTGSRRRHRVRSICPSRARPASRPVSFPWCCTIQRLIRWPDLPASCPWDTELALHCPSTSAPLSMLRLS